LTGGFSFDFVGALTWRLREKSTRRPEQDQAASTMTEQAVARTMTRTLERVERPVCTAMNFLPLGTNAKRPRPAPLVAKGDSAVQQLLQICHNNFERQYIDFSCFSGASSREPSTTWCGPGPAPGHDWVSVEWAKSWLGNRSLLCHSLKNGIEHHLSCA
jgi:hypothetical protein